MTALGRVVGPIWRGPQIIRGALIEMRASCGPRFKLSGPKEAKVAEPVVMGMSLNVHDSFKWRFTGRPQSDFELAKLAESQ